MLRRLLWWSVTCTIAGISTFGVRPAQACICESSGPPCQAAFKTPVVFLGRVLSISNAVSSGARPRSVNLVRIAVSQSFGGLSASEKEITVSTADNEGECGYSFVVGTEYIVYGRCRLERMTRAFARGREMPRPPPTIWPVWAMSLQLRGNTGRLSGGT